MNDILLKNQTANQTGITVPSLRHLGKRYLRIKDSVPSSAVKLAQVDWESGDITLSFGESYRTRPNGERILRGFSNDDAAHLECFANAFGTVTGIRSSDVFDANGETQQGRVSALAITLDPGTLVNRILLEQTNIQEDQIPALTQAIKDGDQEALNNITGRTDLTIDTIKTNVNRTIQAITNERFDELAVDHSAMQVSDAEFGWNNITLATQIEIFRRFKNNDDDIKRSGSNAIDSMIETVDRIRDEYGIDSPEYTQVAQSCAILSSKIASTRKIQLGREYYSHGLLEGTKYKELHALNILMENGLDPATANLPFHENYDQAETSLLVNVLQDMQNNDNSRFTMTDVEKLAEIFSKPEDGSTFKYNSSNNSDLRLYVKIKKAGFDNIEQFLDPKQFTNDEQRLINQLIDIEQTDPLIFNTIKELHRTGEDVHRFKNDRGKIKEEPMHQHIRDQLKANGELTRPAQDSSGHKGGPSPTFDQGQPFKP